MIRGQNEQKTYVKELMRGGDGSVSFNDLLTPEEMYGKGRVYSKLTLKAGSSIGFHVHEGEMEAFYIIKGAGEADDNGEKKAVRAGDVLYTPDGTGHAIRNTGGAEDFDALTDREKGEIEDLELIALILYK